MVDLDHPDTINMTLGTFTNSKHVRKKPREEPAEYIANKHQNSIRKSKSNARLYIRNVLVKISHDTSQYFNLRIHSLNFQQAYKRR